MILFKLIVIGFLPDQTTPGKKKTDISICYNKRISLEIRRIVSEGILEEEIQVDRVNSIIISKTKTVIIVFIIIL